MEATTKRESNPHKTPKGLRDSTPTIKAPTGPAAPNDHVVEKELRGGPSPQGNSHGQRGEIAAAAAAAVVVVAAATAVAAAAADSRIQKESAVPINNQDSGSNRYLGCDPHHTPGHANPATNFQPKEG